MDKEEVKKEVKKKATTVKKKVEDKEKAVKKDVNKKTTTAAKKVTTKKDEVKKEVKAKANTVKKVVKEDQKDVKKKVTATKKSVEDKKDEIKKEVKKKTAAVKKEVGAKEKEIKKELDEKKDEVLKEVKAKGVEVKEKIELKEQELDKKLDALKDNTTLFTKEEIEKGKGMSVLAYLGFFSLVPYFAERKNKFVIYHTNQGLNLFTIWLLYYLFCILITSIFRTSESCFGIKACYHTPWVIKFPLVLVGILLLMLSFTGVVNVIRGEAKELPIVKKFKLFK